MCADLLFNGKYNSPPVTKETFIKLARIDSCDVIEISRLLDTERWARHGESTSSTNQAAKHNHQKRSETELPLTSARKLQTMSCLRLCIPDSTSMQYFGRTLLYSATHKQH